MVLTTIFAALALVQTPSAVLGARKGPVDFQRTSAQAEKRISLQIEDATLVDALGKLPKMDYAVDAEAFKGRRISLSLTDVPLTEALNAIAAALDAHWERVGGVRVLKKGAESRPFREMDLGIPKAFAPRKLPDFGKAKPGESPFLFPKEALESLGKARGPFGPEGFRFGPMEPAQQEELRKALEGLRGTMPQPEALRKALEGAFEVRPKPNAPKGDAKARKEYEAAVEDIARRRRAIEQERRTGRKVQGEAHVGDTGAPRVQVKALMASLTPAQRELAKTQGYLKLSDLSPEQRKLTGIEGKGSFEIVIKTDVESLTIKG